jgi:hypothetical protein
MEVIKRYDSQLKTMNYITKYEGDSDIFNTDIEKSNKAILKEFYTANNWLLAQGYEEYIEIASNTLNPVQQHAFLPLREYRIKRNGHYKRVNIYHRFWGGCWIEEVPQC